MARPPQFSRSDDLPAASLEAVKQDLKRLSPTDRAHLLAWLCIYFRDDGAMFSPQISHRRQRIVFDSVEYWLVRVPKRK
jgi:hypothetical protein